jgi:hypothetical protein
MFERFLKCVSNAYKNIHDVLYDVLNTCFTGKVERYTCLKPSSRNFVGYCAKGDLENVKRLYDRFTEHAKTGLRHAMLCMSIVMKGKISETVYFLMRASYENAVFSVNLLHTEDIKKLNPYLTDFYPLIMGEYRDILVREIKNNNVEAVKRLVNVSRDIFYSSSRSFFLQALEVAIESKNEVIVSLFLEKMYEREESKNESKDETKDETQLKELDNLLKLAITNDLNVISEFLVVKGANPRLGLRLTTSNNIKRTMNKYIK